MKLVGIIFAALAFALALAATGARAHTMAGALTWNRQISRIIYASCVSCHREGGRAFSLMTYPEARERAEAIKREVLARRMPPWGAVQGFGDLGADGGLSQAQIDMLLDWIDGGMARGNNPRALPEPPIFSEPQAFEAPSGAVAVSGELTLDRRLSVSGIQPLQVAPDASLPITALLPNGRVVPLVWLYEYRDEYRHPFLFRKPIDLPAGTVIRGVPAEAKVLLIPRR